VPSPQSIKNNFSFRFTIWDVGNLLKVGSAELLPKIVTEKGSISNFFQTYMKRGEFTIEKETRLSGPGLFLL